MLKNNINTRSVQEKHVKMLLFTNLEEKTQKLLFFLIENVTETEIVSCEILDVSENGIENNLRERFSRYKENVFPSIYITLFKFILLYLLCQ